MLMLSWTRTRVKKKDPKMTKTRSRTGVPFAASRGINWPLGR